jgi:hypothetical protein
MGYRCGSIEALNKKRKRGDKENNLSIEICFSSGREPASIGLAKWISPEKHKGAGK